MIQLLLQLTMRRGGILGWLHGGGTADSLETLAHYVAVLPTYISIHFLQYYIYTGREVDELTL